MQCVTDLEEAPPLSSPIALTIGSFDGLHLGHQSIMDRIKQSKSSAVVTFQTHPSKVVSPEKGVRRLCTQAHQIDLFAHIGIDLLCLLPFTKKISQWSARTFIETLHEKVPFEQLILGHDARFGRGREGTPEVVRAVGEELGFDTLYLDPVRMDGRPISSGWIREEIEKGHLEKASQLLGRPLSYYATVDVGAGHGRKIGFPTANLDIGQLCAPPLGVYVVSVRHNGHLFPGIANYGVAPTLHHERAALFEAHLFSFSGELYEAEVELILHRFLRPERRFASVADLQQQIALDIEQARLFFS